MSNESPIKRMGPIPKRNFVKPIKGVCEFEILQYNQKGTFSRFQNLKFTLTGIDGKEYTGHAVSDQRSGGAIYFRDTEEMATMLHSNHAPAGGEVTAERKNRF